MARALRNDARRYGIVSITLHWAAALAVLALLATAAWIWVAPTHDAALPRLHLHGSIGMVALPLIGLRIVWHFVERQPAPLGTGSLWRFARATHIVLLVLIAAQLVTGPVDVWSGGWPIGVFDWFRVPSPLGTSLKAWHDPIGDIHRYTGYAIAAILGLHILGAAKHLVVDGDDTVPRMLGLDEPVTRNAPAPNMSDSEPPPA